MAEAIVQAVSAVTMLTPWLVDVVGAAEDMAPRPRFNPAPAWGFLRRIRFLAVMKMRQ